MLTLFCHSYLIRKNETPYFAFITPSRSESFIGCIFTKITAFNENQYFFMIGPAF